METNFFDDIDLNNIDTSNPNSNVQVKKEEKIKNEAEMPDIDIELESEHNNITKESKEETKSIVKLLQEKDNTETVISPGCSIMGNISCSGPVTVSGTIDGNLTSNQSIKILKTGSVSKNVETPENINIEGIVNGSIKGSNIELLESNIKGNIDASGTVYISKNSVVVGNINCDEINIDGAIKGNIVANKSLKLLDGAIIKGSVKSKVVQIDPGAVLDGMCSYINDNSKKYDEIFGKD